jgi:hypothetical protein
MQALAAVQHHSNAIWNNGAAGLSFSLSKQPAHQHGSCKSPYIYKNHADAKAALNAEVTGLRLDVFGCRPNLLTDLVYLTRNLVSLPSQLS